MGSGADWTQRFMMIGTERGELTVVGLCIAVWQEEGGRQCPVSRTHEPVPHHLCPWHSKPQLDELGVGTHREPLCGVSAVGSEGKAGAGCAIPASSGLGIWGWGGLWAWAWSVRVGFEPVVVVMVDRSRAQLFSWENSSADTAVCAGLLSAGR